MNDMTRALNQLKIIWAVDRMIKAKSSRSEALTNWLNQYYEDEAKSDQNAD